MDHSSIDEIMDDLIIHDINDLTNNEEIDNNQIYIDKVLIDRYEPSEELMNEIGVVDYFTVDQIEQVVSEEDTMLLISMESKLFPSYEEDLKEIFLLAFETQNEEIIETVIRIGLIPSLITNDLLIEIFTLIIINSLDSDDNNWIERIYNSSLYKLLFKYGIVEFNLESLEEFAKNYL